MCTCVYNGNVEGRRRHHHLHTIQWTVCVCAIMSGIEQEQERERKKHIFPFYSRQAYISTHAHQNNANIRLCENVEIEWVKKRYIESERECVFVCAYIFMCMFEANTCSRASYHTSTTWTLYTYITSIVNVFHTKLCTSINLSWLNVCFACGCVKWGNKMIDTMQSRTVLVMYHKSKNQWVLPPSPNDTYKWVCARVTPRG